LLICAFLAFGKFEGTATYGCLLEIQRSALFGAAFLKKGRENILDY
jgi:hypothetical protein